MSHLEFLLKIREDSKTPQQHPSFSHFCIGYSQTVKAINFNVGQMTGGQANLLYPFLRRKQRRFVRVRRYQHNHLIKELTASLNDIQMTQRNRIETTRIHCNHDLVSRLAEAILPDADTGVCSDFCVNTGILPVFTQKSNHRYCHLVNTRTLYRWQRKR